MGTEETRRWEHGRQGGGNLGDKGWEQGRQGGGNMGDNGVGMWETKGWKHGRQGGGNKGNKGVKTWEIRGGTMGDKRVGPWETRGWKHGRQGGGNKGNKGVKTWEIRSGNMGDKRVGTWGCMWQRIAEMKEMSLIGKLIEVQFVQAVIRSLRKIFKECTKPTAHKEEIGTGSRKFRPPVSPSPLPYPATRTHPNIHQSCVYINSVAIV